MSVPLQKFREIVLQLLYSYDIAVGEEIDDEAFLASELSVPRKTVGEAYQRMRSLWQVVTRLDSLIEKVCEGYALDRIHRIERNVLRLGLYEMLYDTTIPPKVAIAEAIRLARKFGAPEASSFVNAILDSIYKAQTQQVEDKVD